MIIKKNMGKLYIFGNGFDRHYGLKTSPSDFVEYLRNESIYNETGNAAEIFEASSSSSIDITTSDDDGVFSSTVF